MIVYVTFSGVTAHTVGLFARVVNERFQWCIAEPTIIYRGLEQAGPRSLYAK